MRAAVYTSILVVKICTNSIKTPTNVRSSADVQTYQGISAVRKVMELNFLKQTFDFVWEMRWWCPQSVFHVLWSGWSALKDRFVLKRRRVLLSSATRFMSWWIHFVYENFSAIRKLLFLEFRSSFSLVSLILFFCEHYLLVILEWTL